jgi:hypothetical protein
VGIIVSIIKRTIIFHRSTKEGLNRWKQSNKIIVINLLDSSLENVAFDVLRGSCKLVILGRDKPWKSLAQSIGRLTSRKDSHRRATKRN